MKLINYDLENEIDFDNCPIWTLVCDSPQRFTSLTKDLSEQTRGQQGKWKLIDGVKETEIAKRVAYVADYHNISLNDKKATAVLQDNLKKLAMDAEHILETNDIITRLTKYFGDLTQSVDYPTSIKEADISVLLKVVGVAFLEEYGNLFEKLCDYVTLLSRLTAIKLIVCVHLRSYLTAEHLRRFFRHCCENDIAVLCIENAYKSKLSEEVILFCDEDLCEFFPNS